MVSELDCWMEWIENQMAEEVFEQQNHDDFEDFTGGNSQGFVCNRKVLSVRYIIFE